ncbi:SLC13 family permease [Lentzea flaviverrucosa]|uniref:Di-and tricarboxylate transporter n=1 Tax=Lentzea flaviverrucosa TaxID=200379 RepID=A0A1H9XXQ4_9PSEU|nr:SLC13 family permease [Lentzea flaviverrucosa]RDI17062.1 di/tricarboxylate transporter [Lentzea flaviverrucosa]SES50866.1 Di-and tricarboxylate transporter [Lentzea flaviverrucosa]
MSAELISILVLVVVFVLATTRSINMGALAFAAAFGVGTLVADMKTDDIFKGFPGSLFVVLVGVTFLFAIARANGTTDWLVHRAIRLVGGRIALMPWVMFAITGVLTAIGAVSPAAVAIVAPIAMGFAAKYRISPLLMGVMVVHGAQAGGFSPISIYGTIVNGIVAKEGLPGNEVVLFLASLVVNLLIAAVVFVVLGGMKLARQPLEAPALARTGGGDDALGGGVGDDDTRDVTDVAEERVALTAPRIATLLGLAALVIAALVFDLDVGLAAITVAVLLSVVWPETSKQAITQITWPTVLLICGILTYVAVLQTMGTIKWAGDSVAGVGAPLLAALLICYIGAIVSAFASSVGIMGALIPLAVPFLLQGEVSAIGLIAALAVSATVVDVSPFSTNGALVLAGAQDVDRDKFFKQLMVYGGIMVAAAPPLVWLALVVPGIW